MNKALSFVKGAAVLLAFGLLVPLVAQAEWFSNPPAPAVSKVGLVLTVNGAVSKGSVVISKGTSMTIGWKSTNSRGCVNNWDSETKTEGATTGTLSADRLFLITCYGLGAAQTARVSVIVGEANFVVTSFSITGLKDAYDNGSPPKKIKDTYKADSSATLKAGVRNAGKLAVTGDVVSVYQLSTAGANGPFATFITKTVKGLSSATKDISQGHKFGVDGKTYHFRVCVNKYLAAGTAPLPESDASDASNCKVIGKPYNFK